VEGASSNSKALFVIAENLRDMQIEAWVGELDIGGITPGQSVRFTLEALPGRDFQGKVSQIRLSPQTQDGVVSYKVIVATRNEDMTLLPGMTCELEFIEERRENVLTIPNAALRYTPSSMSGEAVAALVASKKAAMTKAAPGSGVEAAPKEAEAPAANQGRQTSGILDLVGGMGPPPGMRGTRSQSAGGASRSAPKAEWTEKPLWFTLADGKIDCIIVKAGLSDGSVTEIEPSDAADAERLEASQFIVRERVR
jgi:HlyD family secretion protein